MKKLFPVTKLKLCWILTCFISSLFKTSVDAAKPPTMAGEPLNPNDYENGAQIAVMDPIIENDMTINDGTMNDIMEAKQTLRVKSKIVRWPNAKMPYMLDSAFDKNERAMIAKAIELIQGSTCFRVISRTTQVDYVLVRKNINSTNCNSYVGMIGGKQRLNLAERCIQRVGSTAHEFMHAMGFHHEQSRSDRDEFVTVNYNNIIEGRESNFDMRTGKYGNVKGFYDKLSITHYSRTAFSKNGKDTMTPVTGDGALGQRKCLTEGDIGKVNGYYRCDMNKKHLAADNITNIEVEEVLKNSESLTRDKSMPCRDMNESDCRLWAYYGYCGKSEILMTIFCKRTCNKCHMGCVDMNKKCTDWVRKDYCKKYSDYMYYYCARSCRQC